MGTRVTIEQAGFIGTASGKMHVSKAVAVAEKVTDDLGRLERWDIRSLTSREVIGELTTTAFDGLYSAWELDEMGGETSLAKSDAAFMEGVTAILGHPGAGYDYYRKAA